MTVTLLEIWAEDHIGKRDDNGQEDHDVEFLLNESFDELVHEELGLIVERLSREKWYSCIPFLQ